MCCVLCAVCCTLSCVLCAVCCTLSCVLCTVCCTLSCVLCTVYCVLYTELCTVYCVLYTELCTVYCVLCAAGGLCSLTIDKALPEDEGQYKCRVESSSGKAETSCMVLVDGEYHLTLTQLDHHM